MRTDNIVVLFDSIHYVIAAERVFQESKVWLDLVPVPRELSSDCGMALEFHPEDKAEVILLLSDPRVMYKGVHLPKQNGYKDISHEFGN